MAQMNFKEENYQNYYLAENWEYKGIELVSVDLHLFPKTDKNPDDLVGVSIVGRVHEELRDGRGRVVYEPGSEIRQQMFPRNLPGKISDYGTIEEKDGKKVFTPKVKIVDVLYRIGNRIDEDGNKILDPNGNPIWGQPKVIAVQTKDGWLHIGDDEKPVPFNG